MLVYSQECDCQSKFWGLQKKVKQGSTLTLTSNALSLLKAIAGNAGHHMGDQLGNSDLFGHNAS